MRAGAPFEDAERRFARLGVGQAALAIRAFPADPDAGEVATEATLSLVGEALVAGADGLRTADEITRFAVEATGALAGLLWRRGTEGALELVASAGMVPPGDALPSAAAAAERGLLGRPAFGFERNAEVPGLATLSAPLKLGQPSI